jgi:pyrroloquinoline quinone biosynthesis protein D
VITAGSRPRLRRGTLLRYDRVRGCHVLMYPEGVLVLNDTAAAVLRHCDGAATIAEITTTLTGAYRGVRDTDVLGVLARLVDRRMIEVAADG